MLYVPSFGENRSSLKKIPTPNALYNNINCMRHEEIKKINVRRFAKFQCAYHALVYETRRVNVESDVNRNGLYLYNVTDQN